MQLRFSRILTIISVGFFGFIFDTGDERGDSMHKVADDTDRNYTTIGKIGLTITNWGTIGTRNAYWPSQPSCEYPSGSRIEHIYQGGLWVGAEIRSAISSRNGLIAVTSGASDKVSTTTGRGYEFTSIPGTTIIQRSSLSESQYFDEHAISHQDFVGIYTDTAPRDSSDPNDKPVPLGITVRQESYAWNFPFADYFVLLSYTIYNTGRDTLDSVYVGLWDEAVVRNTNNVRPGTPGFFDHATNGYSDSLRMMYSFDFDGIPTPPPADSYVGIKLLGTTPFPIGVDSVGNLKNKSYYNAWKFNATSGDPAYFSPQQDFGSVSGERSRYDRLAAPLAPDKIAFLRTDAGKGNTTSLLSAGPFRTLRPGDSLQVVYSVVCARKFGTVAANQDTREQRKTLYTNAGFAQQAYDGEDVNGNNILDPGEDITGNGKLDHFQLPQPPRPPKVKAVVENQNVTIYWDKATSEYSVDPITRLQDFEGYRIYRSNAGADFTDPENLLLNLTLAGEFDRADNNIGYNTGFERIMLDTATFLPNDTVAYWYSFPPITLHYFESFESPWTNAGTTPDGWSRTNVTGLAEWSQQTNPLSGQLPPIPRTAINGSAVARFAANVQPGSVTRLESPSFSLLGITTADLRFFYANRNGSDRLLVRASTDNGNSWMTLQTLTTTPDSGWHLQTISLASASGKQNVRIGFEATADGGASDIWIDRIKVQSPVQFTHLNGWQYIYGVAAFDKGDSASGIVSLQSKTEIRRVIPGAHSTSARNNQVGVYPNPYYVNAMWDGGTERTRKIYFYNLPARCEIKIYTLAGDVVANLHHDAGTYNGTDIEWFRRFGGIQNTPQFSGGEHAWDLITKFDQAIATGLYLFSVKGADSGEIKTGKFLVIK